jgi:hypothetical protein
MKTLHISTTAQVTLYDRNEDADQTIQTRVENGAGWSAVIASAGSRNPSSRRHRVVIEFSYETCGGVYELCISQHEGDTKLK